jgi:hypothetical protein
MNKELLLLLLLLYIHQKFNNETFSNNFENNINFWELCRVPHCAQYLTVSSTSLCRVPHCVEYFTVSRTILRRVPHFVKYLTASSISLG